MMSGGQLMSGGQCAKMSYREYGNEPAAGEIGHWRIVRKT
jgi:hypothetical protein